MKILVCSMFLFPLTVTSAPVEDTSSDTLDDVLLTDIDSTINRRDALAGARTKSAVPGVWWQSGFLRSNDNWVSYEKAYAVRSETEMAEYNQPRSDAPAGSQGHLLLAKWCLQHDQMDKYRAHMLAAIRFNPSLLTQPNIKRMGYTQIDGRWLSPEQVYGLAKQSADYQRALEKWGDALSRIRNELLGNATEVAAAERQLAEIHSPDAVLVIDAGFASGNSHYHRLAVKTFARINSAASTTALARYAVFSPSETTRNAAIDALRERRLTDFVPDLLNLLVSEAKLEAVDFRFSRSAAISRLRFVQESRTQRRTQVLESVTPIRITMFGVASGGDVVADGLRATGIGKLQRLRYRLSRLAAWDDIDLQRVLRSKIQTTDLNQRVFPVLRETCEEGSEDPAFWWDWWSRYTDFEDPEKVEVLETETFAVRKPDLALTETFHFCMGCSCFVAGTPVVTETGYRPIEQIAIGDRVLSQDIDTGELRFRVVQQTTVRRPHKTLTVHFGSECITSTGGHNFWKAGTGWVRARDLEPGDRIRTPTKTVEVTKLSPASPAKTYNLVVEGFHTYFVGESDLLVQDVLPIRPTDNVLPGLSRFAVNQAE